MNNNTKIAFHDVFGMTVRGTTQAIIKWAHWGRELLNLSPIIVYNLNSQHIDSGVIEKLSEEFFVCGYSTLSDLERILDDHSCEYLFMEKEGYNDGIISRNSKNLINAISGYWQPYWNHGDVYAMGSEWLSGLTNYTIPYVPYIVELPNVNDDLRRELNIPKSAFVIGRTGGHDTFDINWVKKVIKKVIRKRNDIYFIFQNTPKFINNKRVIHLPKNFSEIHKVKFINTCDAMLHARLWGESFGLACAEFSLCNKPIITYSESKEMSHLEILGEKAIKYSRAVELERILLDIQHSDIAGKDWNRYKQFNPYDVMKKFEEVYLKE